MNTNPVQRMIVHIYAGFIGLIAFGVYVKTLAPTVSFFDSGELIAAAYSLGVAHPPGYPLYVLLGWLFSRIPTCLCYGRQIGPVAYRLNLMSAFFGAGATLMVYYATYTCLNLVQRARAGRPDAAGSETADPAAPERMLYPIIAMVAALTFAFSITHWRHAVVAEVYTLNAFVCGLILFLLLRWRVKRRPGLLWAVALVFGLGFGNHQTSLLFAPAAVLLVLLTTPRLIFKAKQVLLILLFLALGLSVYLLLPLRAAQNPPINWGNPATLQQFIWVVTRQGYSAVERGQGLPALWRDLVNRPEAADQEAAAGAAPQQRPQLTGLRRIWHVTIHSYFLRQLASFNLRREFSVFGAVLALLGVLYSLYRRPVIGASLLLAVGCFVIVTVLVGDPPPENIFLVQEFYTPAYLAAAVWVGLGLLALSHYILWIASFNRTLQYVLVFLLAINFLVLPGRQVLTNAGPVDRRHNYVAYDYAGNIFKSLPPNAILFTWGDSGAFPLWYLQIAEGRRPDLTLLHTPHLGAAWYLQTLPADLFAVADPAAAYSGNPAATLEAVIRHNFPERPVFFDYSSTHSLALPYQLLPHGIVYKLALPGEKVNDDVWERYRFRGILDNTPIALDPDIERTFFMYGSAQMELGHYYLQIDRLNEAAEAFNKAVQFAPELGETIVESLRSQDKVIGTQRPPERARE